MNKGYQSKNNLIANVMVERTEENSASSALQDLREHILGRLSWVDTNTFLSSMPTHCVDGRGGCAIAGAAGGEAGEFLLALATYEELSGKMIDSEMIDILFSKYLSWAGHFYVHSDTHMIEKLTEVLLKDPEFASYFSEIKHEELKSEVENFVRMPPNKLQGSLLKHLLDLPSLGCGHLKLMREHSDLYRVRRELTAGVISAFFRALWKGIRVEWEVLDGDHQEQAVVNVYVDTSKEDISTVPLVAPQCFGSQVFVNHPQAAHLVFGRLYEFVNENLGGKKLDKDHFMGTISKLAGVHTLTTLSYLAKGLPIYSVYVSENGGYRVEESGTVA